MSEFSSFLCVKEIILPGKLITLVPLSDDYIDDLLAAAIIDRDLAQYTWIPGDYSSMFSYVTDMLVEKSMGVCIPFVVIENASQRVIGSTRLMNIQQWFCGKDNDQVTVGNIGGTWILKKFHGTGVNAEMKKLMLDYAFFQLNFLRVSFITDARNARSRRALEKIGAVFEGIRRACMPAVDTEMCDVAFYSILRNEWPKHD